MQIKNRKAVTNMLIEHIAAGRYILDLIEKEENDLKIISVAFYKSNRSNTLRHLITVGMEVYDDLIQQGYEHDQEFKDSLMKVVDGLVGDSVEDIENKKFGSAIESGD